jgi:hypothetical protein
VVKRATERRPIAASISEATLRSRFVTERSPASTSILATTTALSTRKSRWIRRDPSQRPSLAK